MNRPTYFEAVGALTELPAGHWRQLAASGKEVVPGVEGVRAYGQGQWSSDIKYVVQTTREAFEVLETRELLPEGWSWDEERLFSRIPRNARVVTVNPEQVVGSLEIPMARDGVRRVLIRSDAEIAFNGASELLVDAGYSSIRVWASLGKDLMVTSGQPVDLNASGDLKRVGAPLAPPAPFPPDIASCVLFGADPRGVATAEAVARETERARHPPADRRIVWRIIDRKIVQEQPACALLDTGYQLGAVTPEALVLWMPW